VTTAGNDSKSYHSNRAYHRLLSHCTYSPPISLPTHTVNRVTSQTHTGRSTTHNHLTKDDRLTSISHSIRPQRAANPRAHSRYPRFAQLTQAGSQHIRQVTRCPHSLQQPDRPGRSSQSPAHRQTRRTESSGLCPGRLFPAH
jgi:hypothetical protein